MPTWNCIFFPTMTIKRLKKSKHGAEHFAAHLSRLDLIRTLARLAADKHSSAQGKLLVLKEKLHSLFRKGPPQDIAKILSRLTIDLPALRHNLNDKIHQTFDHIAKF